MITLILVDLDNLLVPDSRGIRKLPDPVELAASKTLSLATGQGGGEARVVPVVVAMNDATASAPGVTWEAVGELARGLARAVEERLQRPKPLRIEVEPALVPPLPEAADGALVTLLRRAPGARGEGDVGDVVLHTKNHWIRDRVGGLLPRFRKLGGREVTRWVGGSFRRIGPSTPTLAPIEPTTGPTRVITTGEHAAWAATKEVQLDPCTLPEAGVCVLCDPWLRTQLSVTSQSVTGPERLWALLEGARPRLTAGEGEVMDFQVGEPPWRDHAQLEDVGPGTLRARWAPHGAQVVRSTLPPALLGGRASVVRRKPARIDDGALLRSLEGEVFSDPSWTVAFSKHRGFHCEVERSTWLALWWHRRKGHGHGMTAKVAGQGVSTPKAMRRVPVRLRVLDRRIEVRSGVDAGPVQLQHRGLKGQLVAATGAAGRCVVLCAADLQPGGDLACTPVQDIEPDQLAGLLRADAGWLVRQGVFELPVVVAGVSNLAGVRRPGEAR